MRYRGIMDKKLIKELRKMTSAGLFKCRDALIACNEDVEKAKKYLRHYPTSTPLGFWSYYKYSYCPQCDRFYSLKICAVTCERCGNTLEGEELRVHSMLSASEANQKTRNNIKKCLTKELSELEKQIDEAISNGKFSISNDGYLQSETKDRLEELGYKVSTGSQYNESYYSISWK